MKKGLDESADNFVFTALRGIQAGREYYVAMCPLRIIPKIFLFNESEIPAGLRAQRTLNKARIPEMTAYLTKNNQSYVFSSITASIDGDVTFKPIEQEGHLSKTGTLVVPMNARFLINDGQHRRAAIERALLERPELGMETISVVFYIDRGLKHSQQMFSDLNKHAVRPTTSLNILYDHRNDFSRTLVSTLSEIPIFANNFTELEKTSISNRANKVFTLNSIHHATKALLGKTEKRPTISEAEKQSMVEFWNEVYSNVKEWQDVVNGKAAPYDLRNEYVHVYGVVLHAIGIMGYDLLKLNPKNWKKKLQSLRTIDWRRSNTKEWEGRAMINGRLSKIRTNLILTSNLLKQKVGLTLTREEQKLEQKKGG